MKKFLLILCSVILLTGCSAKTPENSVSEVATEEMTETATEAEEKTEISTENNSVKPTYISNKQKEYPNVTELNLAAPNKNDQINKRKTIFFSDNGYFYYTYVGRILTI